MSFSQENEGREGSTVQMKSLLPTRKQSVVEGGTEAKEKKAKT
jgi:hypothetical protein